MSVNFKVDKLSRMECLITVTGDDMLDPIHIPCTILEAIGLSWKIRELTGAEQNDPE